MLIYSGTIDVFFTCNSRKNIRKSKAHVTRSCNISSTCRNTLDETIALVFFSLSIIFQQCSWDNHYSLIFVLCRYSICLSKSPTNLCCDAKGTTQSCSATLNNYLFGISFCTQGECQALKSHKVLYLFYVFKSDHRLG